PSLVKEPIIIIENEGWHAGVVGIVAARMVEKYAKPCLIISCDGDEAKGSGRSIEGFSLYDALCIVKDCLTHYGGHTLAVGFSLKTADIPDFREKINRYASGVDMPFARLNIDCKLRAEALTVKTVEAFSVLEPFGAGNPQPTVGVYGVTLTSVQPIGNGKHLRLGFTKKGCSFTALRFGMGEDKFQYEPGDVLDLAVKPEINEFRGETSVSVQIKGIRPAGRDDDAFLSGVALFEKITRGAEITKQEALEAYPDRSFVSAVYKTVRDLKVKQADPDKICMYTGKDKASVCRTLIACEALFELGILEKNEDGNPVLPQVTVKNSLDNSILLLKLKRIAGV
ncbi:MAG: DHHA1 domain-containing protein, partial [Clostridia bacterium]|nr:DHHA1 domain-containing protein [Clostridia bacterium]